MSPARVPIASLLQTKGRAPGGRSRLQRQRSLQPQRLPRGAVFHDEVAVLQPDVVYVSHGFSRLVAERRLDISV